MTDQRPDPTPASTASASISGRSPLAAATVVADWLASADMAAASVTGTAWWRQSLAHGAPGVALLHIELAAREMRSWQRAHDWISYLAAAPVTTGPDSHLYYGAPALAHVLACAAACRSGAYHAALDRARVHLACAPHFMGPGKKELIRCVAGSEPRSRGRCHRSRRGQSRLDLVNIIGQTST